ncbi:beta-mannosidase [Lasioglossum baleicum]|uniref:beta-mannosidase n=1 Tax=Lasioglossum baleicum TaxID=434251 RepID=UPI003FCEA3C5
MSNNMDRDKPELLTTKEKEEEEMKRELRDMKMYESWYTYKEMKDILGFINESKDMANVGKDEKNAQKELLHTSNECSAELVSKSNLAHELEIEEDSDLSRLIHSHKSNHTSPIHDQILSRNHDSPELAPAIADSRNYLYRNKTLDNDDIFDKLHDNLNMRDNYSRNLNKYIPLKEKNTLQDSHGTNDAEIKVDTHLNNSQKLERWQINPLDSCVSENDVPLQEPERPLAQDRMLFKLCKNADTSESFEKLLAALNMHLKRTAEFWYSWHHTADSKFQWGSPIQVEVAKSSLDRKSLTNSKTEENSMECTDIYNIERPNKRKSALVVSSSNTSHSDSDEDDIVIKKKKTQPYELSNRVLHSDNEMCVTVGENEYVDNEDIRKNTVTETKSLDVEQKKCEYLSSELLPSYSRKITPPSTRKCINKKKKHNTNILANASSPYDSSEEQSAINLDCQEKNNILTDEEILLELEKDNAADEMKTSSETTEIKPLPIKGLSHRIKNECMILDRIQMEKQKKMETVKEQAQRKEQEEKRKREEFYKKQIEERQQRQKQREEREKSREEMGKKWKSIANIKSQKQASEENKKRIYDLYKQNQNETLFQENSSSTIRKMDVTIDDVSNNVNCPICNQCFPSDKIETHAAGCEQYVTDNEDENNASFTRSRIAPINTNNEEILECGVCLKYTTTNCTNYEQHVNNCLQKQHQEESSLGKITMEKSGHAIMFPATVPGGIYTDLYKANIISENLAASNDVNNRWIGNQSVIYSKRFHVNKTLLSAPKVILIFHGLDTFATISINAQEIGKTSNMFVQYTFDITKYLKKGENSLSVFFDSAVKKAKALYETQAMRYIVPPVCVPTTYNGECHVNHIRKMQASFSWDWGPAFPSMGIWKSVEVIPVNDIFIKNIATDVLKVEKFWNIIATIHLEVIQQRNIQLLPCEISCILNINGQTNISNSNTIILNTSNASIETNISLKIPVKLVDKWWPNGYGNQTLYSLTIIATTNNGRKRKSVRIGFRTVELVQKPLKKGLSFYFQINGIPIFAKGSNYIPASIFPEQSAKPDTIKHLLESVKAANMNMLRVWGGGLYESELFYSLADEYGIMIWQDFMFACGMYPTTETFLESVKEEVVQNVRRLKNHPSIVLWAGNNENEAALYENWYGTGTSRIYKTDYVKLYVDLIKKEVEQLDSTRPFVVSSPSNGLYAEQYNYTEENPYSKFYGDVHYYNYVNNGWDMHQYPLARFSSEYGFQSLPSIYTMIPVVETINDLNEDSDFMMHRQHLPLGNLYMRGLISKNFKIPNLQNTMLDFENFIYLSQINQAVSVKVQTEFYRQSMSELNEIGEGMTMGALYWQLNDVWQAPSWSSIDINGRWKMLHYYAVDFFAPIIVTYYIKVTDFSIYIVSEKLHPITNTTLEVNLYTSNSMKPVQSYSFHNITIQANAATKIHNNAHLNSTIIPECQIDRTAKSNCITTLTLKDETGSQIAPRNYIYPSDGFKTIVLPMVNISVEVNDYRIPGTYSNYPDMVCELTTDNVAFFVSLEAGNICGRFSENGFHMFERRKTVVFHACEAVTHEVFKFYLRITTLSDIYNPKKEDTYTIFY